MLVKHWSMKPVFALKCSKTWRVLTGGFHFLAPVLWPTGPEASSPGKWHTFCCFFQSLHGARFEGKPTKKYAEQSSRCQKASNLETETLGTKRGWSSPWFLIPSYTQIKMSAKKYYLLPQKSKKIIANQMWLAIFVLASGFSSSTVAFAGASIRPLAKGRSQLRDSLGIFQVSKDGLSPGGGPRPQQEHEVGKKSGERKTLQINTTWYP